MRRKSEVEGEVEVEVEGIIREQEQRSERSICFGSALSARFTLFLSLSLCFSLAVGKNFVSVLLLLLLLHRNSFFQRTKNACKKRKKLLLNKSWTLE